MNKSVKLASRTSIIALALSIFYTKPGCASSYVPSSSKAALAAGAAALGAVPLWLYYSSYNAFDREVDKIQGTYKSYLPFINLDRSQNITVTNPLQLKQVLNKVPKSVNFIADLDNDIEFLGSGRWVAIGREANQKTAILKAKLPKLKDFSIIHFLEERDECKVVRPVEPPPYRDKG